MEPQDEIVMRAVVKGRVQGVGFRIAARNYATRLGLSGTVRNLPDGSVELVAAGKRSAVESLLEAIRAHAVAGRVSAVFTEELNATPIYEGFVIL